MFIASCRRASTIGLLLPLTVVLVACSGSGPAGSATTVQATTEPPARSAAASYPQAYNASERSSPVLASSTTPRPSLLLASTATKTSVGGGIGAAASAAPPAPQIPGAVNIPLADNPKQITVSPDQKYAYIPAAGDNMLCIVNLKTRALSLVKVGTDPLNVALNASGRTAYVANGSGTISVVDTTTRKVTRTLRVGGFPVGVAVRTQPSGDQLLVADSTGNRVLRLSSTGTTLNRWSITAPAGVAVTANGTIVAPSSSDGTVLVIKANLAPVIPAPQRTDGSPTNPGSVSTIGNTVTLPGDDTTWFDTTTMKFSGKLPAIAPGVTSGSAPYRGTAYTLLSTRAPSGDGPPIAGKLSVIRMKDHTTVQTLKVGTNPESVAYANGSVLVTQGPNNSGQFDLLVIPGAAITAH